MKLGILQGRLSPPVNGAIQEFPIINWEVEFSHLKTLNLHGLEWIITKKDFLNNPFFSLHKKNNQILSVCADNIIDERIINYDFLSDSLIPILQKMLEIKIKTLVIPLLEQSSVCDENIASKFIDNIVRISDLYSTIDFCFEFEAPKQLIQDFISARKNFFITYDTGNFTSFVGENVNHSELIEFFNYKIKNVHLKDRTFSGESRPVFLGNTNFDEIFISLKKIKYKKNLIMQFARGETNSELDYISTTVKKLKKYNF